jgi:ankyrin repeat protein
MLPLAISWALKLVIKIITAIQLGFHLLAQKLKQDICHEHPIFDAIFNEDEIALGEIIASISDPIISSNHLTPFQYAILQGKWRLLDKLKHLNIMMSPECGLLHLAAFSGCIDTFTHLVKKYPCKIDEMTFTGDSVQHWAVLGEHLNMLIFLSFEHRIDFSTLNHKQEGLLHTAVRVNWGEGIHYLVDTVGLGQDVENASGLTPAMLAARLRYISVLEYLIRKDSSELDRESSKGWTLMHVAAAAGQTDVIQHLFLHHNVRPDRMNRQQHTPIDLAIHYAKEGAMRLLKALSHRDHVNVDRMLITAFERTRAGSAVASSSSSSTRVTRIQSTPKPY